VENFYNNISLKSSKLVANAYSTSFSLGIKALHKDLHEPIYAIYGFVRLADEIVDSFHSHDKEKLLLEFEKDTYKAIEEKISLNPILNSFQLVVNQYDIDHALIDKFLMSMKMDLNLKDYKDEDYKTYIFGSAETVGLMCLKVFCEGDEKEYLRLKDSAQKLGSSFQKINFLRDFKSDYYDLNRIYFPELSIKDFNDENKVKIESEIEKEFQESLIGIKQLPKKARFGVYLAYTYYYSLLKKIQKLPAKEILTKRIRISNTKKYLLCIKCIVKYKLGLI